MKTIKYPRTLAKVENTSRRQHDLKKIRANNPGDKELLLKKSTFTYRAVHSYLFDSISKLCTEYGDQKYELPDGTIRHIVDRQDDPLETHYRSILRIETLAEFALNGHYEYYQNFLVQLYKLAAKPEKKVLPFMDEYEILTEPIRVDLVTETGDKVSEADKAKLMQLGSDIRKTKNGKDVRAKFTKERHHTGRVVLVVIEYYKPLFASLLEPNSKGGLGKNYFQCPQGFTAETKSTINI